MSVTREQWDRFVQAFRDELADSRHDASTEFLRGRHEDQYILARLNDAGTEWYPMQYSDEQVLSPNPKNFAVQYVREYLAEVQRRGPSF